MPRLKAAQRKDQLISVATRVFARLGYDAATTHEIAEAAGITEPILYRHFKSKQDMFVAIVRKMSQVKLARWNDLIADIDDPIQQIRLIAKEYPKHIHSLSDAYRVINGALACSRDRRVISVLKEHYKEVESFFAQIIRRGQKARVFRTDLDLDAPTWQIIHLGIGYSLISLNLSGVNQFPLGDAIEFVLTGIRK